MTTESLRGVLEARPFVPFVLRHADGRERPRERGSPQVTHPEAMAYRGGRVAAYLYPDGGFEVIELLRVTSLLIGAPGGGRRPRKGGR
jgi:hypothetical protein